jgi:hypothetical protein
VTVLHFGDYDESRHARVAIAPYSRFIAFDVSDGQADLIVTNISVTEAERIRKELKQAIDAIEGKTH